jgi:UDP:flavonoid glycosyltransferase YjiC (YdhE family)
LRVLFTVRPGLGLLHPLVPIARAMASAGHEVTFASAPHFVPIVERTGFRCVPAGLDSTDRYAEQLIPEMRGLVGRARAAMMWRRMFSEHAPAKMVPDLLELFRTWTPDLIVRDDLEFGGCIAAERLGVPHAAIHTVSFRPHLYDQIKEPLNEQRVQAGLPLDPELAMPFRYLFLSPFPSSYLNPAVLLPPTTHHLRPVPFDRSGEEAIPAWLYHLPERPLVYLTLGTIFNYWTDIFRAFIEGLRDEPLNLVVTVGRNGNPEQFGPQPENVCIERYIPQTLLFPRCDVVITHGGSGTTMAALSHGLPLIIVPIAADQPENADRCAALGVARVIQPADLSANLAREATRDVLRSTSYRQAAERLRDEITALPGPEHAVELLEQLARNRVPIMAPR